MSALLLLHGSGLDEALLVGAVAIYLGLVFFFSERKKRRLKQEKARRKAEKAAAAQNQSETNLPGGPVSE